MAGTLEGTHLRRFHIDTERHLTGYGVFHGDNRQPDGEPLPTGSLRRSLTGGTSAGVYHEFGGGPPEAYTIRPTMSLKSVQEKVPVGSTLTSTVGRTLPSNRSKGLNSSSYEFKSGAFKSTSGLPPLQYKAWTTEYVDEYRGPIARKENLKTLTLTHGTSDALRSSRYQFQGYPHTFKSYAPSSLTQKGQNMPNYESRVNAF
ncbi:hypothetical protein CEUSTIGMA_g4347.t1 [Chlamydomonas eustigma]|uniref:Uncharacterized protein n=1 Tax=Chlamydomonas eustigma TaxID=1157962 RepID=A0A250X1F1_9CHLO|nr:hypothetical protein CEUSTIGMA_g4347.t1 [Chlamydomonas eustigma]|eukprot:GAX76901.1 hypothetical protein CEUSTIGMA_g4347.t1 [Chlamydomonas eustigma]